MEPSSPSSPQGGTCSGSDIFEYANGTKAAAAAPAQSSPPPPSQPAHEPETGLRYMLAMRQLDCEIRRLRSPELIDVALGADVKPDILKDLLKVDVPDVRKSVDRARDALKTLTAVATVADAEKLLDAQDACERALSWIAMVEKRCKGEQLHLDIKQEPREVDFVPFRPGNGREQGARRRQGELPDNEEPPGGEVGHV
jgi:hypothetical protein